MSAMSVCPGGQPNVQRHSEWRLGQPAGPRRHPGHPAFGKACKGDCWGTEKFFTLWNTLAEVWVINHPERNLSFWSAMQITVKWQECSVCLAAEHEGDSVLHTSQHSGPDPISSHHPVWLGASAAGSVCLCCQKPDSLLAVGLCMPWLFLSWHLPLLLVHPGWHPTCPSRLVCASACRCQVPEPHRRSLKSAGRCPYPSCVSGLRCFSP